MYGYELDASQYPLATHTTVDIFGRLAEDNMLWIFMWIVSGTVIDEFMAPYQRAQPLPLFQPYTSIRGVWHHTERYLMIQRSWLNTGRFWYAPNPSYGVLPDRHWFFDEMRRLGSQRNVGEPGWTDILIAWRLNVDRVRHLLYRSGGNLDAIPRLQFQHALSWMDRVG
jgi:hypothetical protein